MPPRKGIVKSGNAGNSSKASGKDVDTAGKLTDAQGEKFQPLFPPGSKYPASLLHEHCQKNGWEKPIIDTRKQENGYSFSVTLIRINKKTSERESVRLEPHPIKVLDSVIEARHWGATYAMYRFLNNLQLNRVLPRGPGDYWKVLATEHKDAPEHMKWMYDADPFAARKQVNERQVRAAEKRANIESGENMRKNTPPLSSEFSQEPEVKMAVALRDQVEKAVKQGLALYPMDAERSEPLVIPTEEAPNVVKQLMHLGFELAQARNAVDFLSKPSPIAEKFLGTLSSLDASIEYLVLHLPEETLPKRFLPSMNSSNPFVTALHSGSDNLKARWMAEKAVKEAGWPAHVVQEIASNSRHIDEWDLLMATLGKKLIGDDIPISRNLDGRQIFQIDVQEAEAFGAHFEDPHHLLMPMFTAPVTLHVMISPEGLYPCSNYAPMYITGLSIPAYVRLHLLSRLLLAVQIPDFQQDGEGFCTAVMRCLEEVWAEIEDNGPPDMLEVLKYFIPAQSTASFEASASLTITPRKTQKNPRRAIRKGDARSNEQVKAEFNEICQTQKYHEMLSERQKLPSFAVEAQFLKLLESHRVVVVVGETGCGKTTQLPQFILDSLINSNRGSRASILVTQPRRLSTIGVANRVSAERLDDGSVGYAIRGESKQSEKTKLLFCTTGVILRRLSLGDELEDVSHIVVDEVHERSVDGDFLLLELRELLKHHSKLKVVLMSATINHEVFSRYFGGALLKIPGFTHPVTDKYLEDFVRDIDYHPSKKSGKSDKFQKANEESLRSQGLDEKSISVVQTIIQSDRIDYQLLAALVNHIVTSPQKRGGILIFLPGVQEIRQCMDTLAGTLTGNNVDILPLHANLSSAEQMKVFAKTSKWKVIAATNVAETSITINDVIYVIDAGKMKEVQYDAGTNISKLVEIWVTRAAARQRKGRAGRTQPGTCYKLYTRTQEENMAQYSVPEILRVPLENVFLTAKTIHENRDIKQYLAQAIDPPEVRAIETALSILEELGAIDEKEKLTSLGRHISTLPIDLRLAKMLVLGTIFRCLGPTLTIAACLSSKPLFIAPLDKRDEATQARARFAKGNSDLLTDISAYDECLRRRSEGKSQSAIRQFCEQNFISMSSLQEISTLRRDYITPLAAMGFIPLDSTPDSSELNVNSSDENLLKAIILGGLWPRITRVHLPRSAIKFDKLGSGSVQRENTARDFKLFDIHGGRVFLHPSSVLFGHASWKSPFAVYFHKAMTTKLFLRDITEIPIWSILLFGGRISINHVGGGLTICTRDSKIKLKAWPRIGILVEHIRHLLEAKLQQCIEEGSMLSGGKDEPVITAILALLANDGM